MAEQVTVGQVSIKAVSDIQMGGMRQYMFPRVTEEQWEPWRHYLNERGNLHINIGTFAVRSEGKTILIDTGLGEKQRENFPPRPPRMLDGLAEAGITPEVVDLVVTTHLHVDHVGWNTTRRGEEWVPTFPRARYLVVRKEWEYFTQPEQVATHEYLRDSVLPLESTGQLDLVDSEHRVTSELTLVPAPGHTPAHVCVAIVSGAERAMIIGDMAHHPIQLTETAWAVWADLDPKTAAETRARMVERMEREHDIVIGGHFPPPGIGRLVRLGERRVWQAL